VVDPIRGFPSTNPDLEWPKRNPPKLELPKAELPECAPIKPIPGRVGSIRAFPPAPAPPAKRVPLGDRVPPDGPKECHAPSYLPPLRLRKLAFVQPRELRPPLE